MNGQQTTQHRVVAIVAVAAVLGLLIFGSSCSLIMSSNWNPRGDWELPLCNGYYIFRTSSRDICVVHERDNYKDSFEDIIDSYITCFLYNSRYIAVRRLVVADRALLDDIQSVDTEAADYYLIDAETDTIYRRSGRMDPNCPGPRRRGVLETGRYGPARDETFAFSRFRITYRKEVPFCAEQSSFSR